jgi:small subunit ribosomal protein S24e
LSMELKVRQDNYNALLKRKEVMIEVEHEKAGTPSRLELKKAVASKYGTKLENVFIMDVETKTGTQNAFCEVQVYDDPKTAANIVPKYLQVRDLPAEEKKQAKEQKAKKKEEAPKEEKPKPGKGKEEKPKQEDKKEERKEEKAQPEPAKKVKESTAH